MEGNLLAVFLLLFLGAVKEVKVSNVCKENVVIQTKTACQPCILNAKISCPAGYKRNTQGSGTSDCRYYREIVLQTLSFPGCRHTCIKEAVETKCCKGAWGQDCLDCPGGKESPCNNRGTCSDGIQGNGTCMCQVGFGGTACERCAEDKLYGPNCNSVCSCVHGTCNSGITGDGTCTCYSGYTGPQCDQSIPECETMACPQNSRCTLLSTGRLACMCLPYYTGDGKKCELINICVNKVCDPNAQCTMLGPNKYICSCNKGFTGDGKVCLPIDPCQENFGNCPPNSTVCKYDAPGKAHCECKDGFQNLIPGKGCTLPDLCRTNNNCHKNAVCTTELPGKITCTCKEGYSGDGFTCYGNIIERMKELNTEGQWQGKLSSAIALFDTEYAWPLSSRGPFTLFVPVNNGFKGTTLQSLTADKLKAKYLAKLHIVAGQIDITAIRTKEPFYTLTGKQGEMTKENKDSQIILGLFGSTKKLKILAGDIIASNGVLHIVDKVMDKVEPSLQSNENKTILEILGDNGRYKKFRMLLQATNLAQTLELPGPHTVFAPSNTAMDGLEKGIYDFLLSSQGSKKLLELVRHHIVHSAEMEVENVMSSRQTVSMANQVIKFNISAKGQILINDIAVEETDVVAKNGRIYSLSGVLIPPSIVPIVPKQCNESSAKMWMGQCKKCKETTTGFCPPGSQPANSLKHSCVYKESVMGMLVPFIGCLMQCIQTTQILKCCPGFYGPVCNPCPGGFDNPCSGNGKCMDKDGNGTCICNKNFKGSSCQFCSRNNMFGPKCDQECPCLHGECDNRPESDGSCKPGSCEAGYAGKFCDMQTRPCGTFIDFCHARADCTFDNGAPRCVCQHGYEGDGITCIKARPCSSIQRGRCSANAECINTGLGNHTCKCLPGWTGDGYDCIEINNCLTEKRGGCHANASCIYIGPGQSTCECNTGFRGTGIECETIDPCIEQQVNCHFLALCFNDSPGTWQCLCPQGYSGDGSICYSNAANELSYLSEANRFKKWLETAGLIQTLKEPGNLTVLVPSLSAIANMDKDEQAFWTSEQNLGTLIKYHILTNTYKLANLVNMFSSNSQLATSLHGNFLSITKENESIAIHGANIVVGDVAATNGVIHVIDKVLIPPQLMSSSVPDLLTRLEQIPEYSIFRGYIIQYSLATGIESGDGYTVFAPSNDAIQNFVQQKRTATLDEDTMKYHVIVGEKLMQQDLHNGMHRETMLGFSYQVGFFLRDTQLFINDVPINYTNLETDKGVIHGIGSVLEIQKNRCDVNDTTIELGKCTTCQNPPVCPPGTVPLVGEKTSCLFTLYLLGTRVMYLGCRAKCVKTIISRDCCSGFYGEQCQSCPGKPGNPCFGNGICQDGINGTGLCECEEGFEGTACESCIKGRYGSNCDQECTCVNGKCSESIEGDGSCDCDISWRGVTCETKITGDNCNSTCHTSANCLIDTDGRWYCKCAAGFKGNGTSCAVMNACETSNGGCSENADCKRTTPGNRQCICKAGYTGDGIVCIGINPCLENHGGCDTHAECTQTGPNQAACNCMQGYTGNGKTCTSINPCETENGGCSENAICNHTGPSERSCECKTGFIGDGIKCRGNVAKELAEDSRTSHFFLQIVAAKMNDITGPGPFTVFVPSQEAFIGEPSVSQWKKTGQMAQILRYHIVGCRQLLFNELMSMKTNITTLHGDVITPSYVQNSLFLNGKAKIIASDYITTNGIIHIIDKVLVPPNLKDVPSKNLDNFTKVAENNGYMVISKLFQDADLLKEITNPLHIPVTVFWPTDKVINSLPKEQKDFLYNKDNKKQLQEYLKYHIIRDAKITASDLPNTNSLTTFQGSNLTAECGKKDNIGDLYLNERKCKIIQRHIEFNGGIAYGIDCLLTPPSIGGRCDITFATEIPGTCGACYNIPPCPPTSKPTEETKKCTYVLPFSRKTTNGCQRVCNLFVWKPKCCDNYFGPNCQACPGGPETPCNNHGTCDSGYSGTGECKCNPGFNGTACELCQPGRFGSECKRCDCTENGQCDEGYDGTGACSCNSGWTGQRCESKQAEVPVCSPACSPNAMCRPNNTCECKPYFEGDGITCKLVDHCKQNNGGCPKTSLCFQSGVKVSCQCQSGYSGDGYNCMPINPCIDGNNGGCHEHATCMMTGPNKRTCECKDGFIGDGVNCTVKETLTNRCLLDNGQCHANANCTDLHFEDSTVGVFHVQSPKGQYKYTYDEAVEACKNEDAKLATYNQLAYAQQAGFHLCSVGWLDEQKAAYPTAYSSQNCGFGKVGIIDYGIRINLNETRDAFCYRMKDVQCTCKYGYVGDGYSCSGNMLQVLMSFPTFNNFLSEILMYYDTSPKGKQFMSQLTNLTLQATLFVPDNVALNENKTLSGRDIEYHISFSKTVYLDDMENGTVLSTPIGHKLLITMDPDQESSSPENKTRYVNGKTIVNWDYIASNGIIHVISEPLIAPPEPPSAIHAGIGLGIFVGVVILIIVLLLVGYYYYRNNKGLFHFRYFKETDEQQLVENETYDEM
ncbi:stabilin-2 [Protopterus annectens]|uniref:stabilin-2 n=1 Tax=Protopterus annectens TaxID=7888 RepID=UPI001CFB48A5|nr:stabilin-2 [Protopterus annectens]